MKRLSAVIAALALFLVALPSFATELEFRSPAKFFKTVSFAADVLGSNVVLTSGNQTVAGTKTFSAAPLFPVTLGAIFKGTSFNSTVINLAGLGQAQTITIPDSGTSAAKFVLTTGTATACASTTAQLDSYVLTVYMADAATAGSVYVQCPFTGTVKSIAEVNDVANTTTKTVFDVHNGATQLTLSAALEQAVADAAGTAHSVTVTANGAVTAGDVLKIDTDGGSASSNQATRFSIVIQR